MRAVRLILSALFFLAPAIAQEQEHAPRDWLGFEAIGGEITPEIILERVRLGKLDQETARTLLETLIETETSLS